MSGSRHLKVFDLIDRANSQDPNTISDGGEDRPAELVYGERMTAALERFYDTPGDHLHIAVRAQHIERWTSKRKSYPEGRAGYLKWRSDLKAYHAKRAGELMREAGYNDEDIERVGALIRKERLKRDPEAQMLEDVVCLVFLEHYASDFIAGHDDEKVMGILAKTARKMSPDGLAAAQKLTLDDRLGSLLVKALG